MFHEIFYTETSRCFSCKNSYHQSAVTSLSTVQTIQLCSTKTSFIGCSIDSLIRMFVCECFLQWGFEIWLTRASLTHWIYSFLLPSFLNRQYRWETKSHPRTLIISTPLSCTVPSKAFASRLLCFFFLTPLKRFLPAICCLLGALLSQLSKCVWTVKLLTLTAAQTL